MTVTFGAVTPQLPGAGVGDGVGDGLGVGEAVGLGVGVGDAVGLGDGVGDAVGVGVGDGVAPQSTTTMALLPFGMTLTTGQACPPFCWTVIVWATAGATKSAEIATRPPVAAVVTEAAATWVTRRVMAIVPRG